MKPEQKKLESGVKSMPKVSKSENSDIKEHADVLTGKTERDVSRRKALDDLARAEYAEGVYDQVPDDFNPEQ
jgi:hypothetical protein